MLVTNHILAGAAIGALVKRPLPALAIGVVSHLAMDAVPHWGLAHEDRQGDPILDKPSRHFFGMSPFPTAVDKFHGDIQEGREHDHRMGQEFAVAAGLAGLVAGLLVAR